MNLTTIQMYIRDMNLSSVSRSDTVKKFQDLIILESKFAARLQKSANGRAVYLAFINSMNHGATLFSHA